jgi:hypothetical protein
MTSANCSGHGVCAHACVNSVRCEPYCVCDEGFVGTACDVLATVQRKYDVFQETVLLSLVEVCATVRFRKVIYLM